MSKHHKSSRGSRATHEEEGEGDQSHPAGERLQKVLAAAGIGSRRECEELITAGRVEIDKQVVTELGTRVDPLHHEIRVDGEALKRPQRLYYAVNKPMGVVTTNFDPAGRARVIDLVPTEQRVFAVGRLDRSSEGLILVTNDGEFANRVTHPRYGVEKTYLVRVAGSPSDAELAKLRKGVYLSDGFVRAQSVVAKKRHGQSTDLVIVLNEGRNREIRRILARVGHKVLRLKRVAVGPIKLADLPVGNWRRLMPAEIEALLAVAKEKRKAKKRAAGKGPGAGDAERKDPIAAISRGDEGSDAPRDSAEPRYVQQRALMEEPLSLDDLLRDDLDEGGPVHSGSEGSFQAGDDMDDYGFDDGPSGQAGGVLAYEEDETDGESEPVDAGEEGVTRESTERPAAPRGRPAFSPRNRQTRSAGGPGGSRKPGGKFQDRRGGKPAVDKRRPAGRDDRSARGDRSGRADRVERGERAGRGERTGRGDRGTRGDERETLPRESYGRKRGGKRVFSRPHEGRGPAGEVGGNFSFRKKSEVRGERNRTRPEGAGYEGRRAEGGGGPSEQTGERPRKRFVKAGGKKFAGSGGGGGGGGGGKKFAKPGGKRFGKSSDGPKPSKRGGARFEKPSGGKFGKRPAGGKRGGGKGQR